MAAAYQSEGQIGNHMRHDGHGGHHRVELWKQSKSISLMLQVYSFDLGDHPYARPAALWLSNQFQGSHAWIAWLLQVCYKSITLEMIPPKIVYPCISLSPTNHLHKSTNRWMFSHDNNADSKAFGYDMGRLFGHGSRFSSSESTCEVRTSDIFICRSDKVIVRFQMGWLIPIRNHFEISILKYYFWVVDMSIVAFQEFLQITGFLDLFFTSGVSWSSSMVDTATMWPSVIWRISQRWRIWRTMSCF